MNYIIVCLIIGFALLIHEFGHLIAARLMGIPVSQFSIGFGPRLWGFQRGETDFRVSLIPLGGYVLPKVETENDFLSIPPLKRIVFSLGGPLANLLSVIPALAVFNTVTKGPSFMGMFVHPLLQTAGYIKQIITAIPLLFSDPEKLSGVVGIVAQGGQIIDSGAVGIIFLAVVLSINLAILNLLPIPALDGGQIFMTIIEKIWPKSSRVRLHLSLLGWLFLISLMIYATGKDISRLMG